MDIKLLHKDAVTPEFTAGNNAIDLRVMLEQQYCILMPGETKLFRSGIAIHIGSGNENFAGFIMPRSGLGHKHGIVIGNLVGLIDHSYTGEIKISLWNRSNEPFKIMHKDRLAQMVFLKTERPIFNEVDDLEDTARGDSGFNSSGVK